MCVCVCGILLALLPELDSSINTKIISFPDILIHHGIKFYQKEKSRWKQIFRRVEQVKSKKKKVK